MKKLLENIFISSKSLFLVIRKYMESLFEVVLSTMIRQSQASLRPRWATHFCSSKNN
jgi:hypothetical protein